MKETAEIICGTLICIFCTPLGWIGMLTFAFCVSTIIEEKKVKVK